MQKVVCFNEVESMDWQIQLREPAHDLNIFRLGRMSGKGNPGCLYDILMLAQSKYRATQTYKKENP